MKIEKKTEVLSNFEKQAASAYMRFKHITKQNGSINNSTKERLLIPI